MTVEISCYAGRATNGLPMASEPGQNGTTAAAQSVTISATASPSTATPDGQTALSLIGTEAFRYEYSLKGTVGAVSTSNYAAAGERIWLTPRSGWIFSLRTP